jgi:hypothetical protein
MSGLRSDDNGTHFGMFFLGWYLIRSMGSGYVETCSGITPNAEAAAGLGGVLFSLSQLFAGFLIRRTAIPRGWIWMHFLSVSKYSVSFLAMNELSGLTFGCPNNQDAVLLSDLNASTNLTLLVANSNGVITCQGIDGGLPCYACPIISGDSMLNVFDFNVSGLSPYCM